MQVHAYAEAGTAPTRREDTSLIQVRSGWVQKVRPAYMRSRESCRYNKRKGGYQLGRVVRNGVFQFATTAVGHPFFNLLRRSSDVDIPAPDVGHLLCHTLSAASCRRPRFRDIRPARRSVPQSATTDCILQSDPFGTSTRS